MTPCPIHPVVQEDCYLLTGSAILEIVAAARRWFAFPCRPLFRRLKGLRGVWVVALFVSPLRLSIEVIKLERALPLWSPLVFARQAQI